MRRGKGKESPLSRKKKGEKQPDVEDVTLCQDWERKRVLKDRVLDAVSP